jgi:hypothetical protein
LLAKLVQSGGLSAIARQLGITHAKALEEARIILPGLIAGVAGFPGGLGAFLDLTGKHGGEQLAVQVMGQNQVSTLAGETIIAQFGMRDLPIEGLSVEDAAIRLKMAPLLTMLIAGYLWARSAAGNLTHAEVSRLLALDDLADRSGQEPV